MSRTEIYSGEIYSEGQVLQHKYKCVYSSGQ